MKNIDFSKPGGMNRTQDDVEAFLQTAWQEVVTPLCNLGVNGGAPTIMSGMVSTTAGSTITVSAGWFVYNGEPVRFPSQTYSTPVAGGDAVYIVITPTLIPLALAYQNGSTPNVKGDATGVLTILPNTTSIDATHFLLSSLVTWPVGLLLNSGTGIVGQWTSYAPTIEATGGGSISVAGAITVYCAYKLVGKTCFVQAQFRAAVVAGTITYLQFVLPFATNNSGAIVATCSYNAGAGRATMWGEISNGLVTYLQLNQDLNTGDVDIDIDVTYEVAP